MLLSETPGENEINFFDDFQPKIIGSFNDFRAKFAFTMKLCRFSFYRLSRISTLQPKEGTLFGKLLFAMYLVGKFLTFPGSTREHDFSHLEIYLL